MGCASSTEVIVDPVTGETKKKQKLGGAYPAQRRPTKQPHVPDASEFAPSIDGKTETATLHFVQYGGGNALVLKDRPNRPPNSFVQPKPEFISVTLPEGVNAGDRIHVRAPDGRLNEIVVPAGMGPGSTFTVEFDSGTPPAPEQADIIAFATPAVGSDNTIPIASVDTTPFASSYPAPPSYPTHTGAIRT